MKKIFITMMLISSVASAKQVFQCAVDTVVPDGARLNVNENNGKIRANLIFGTTVSGTMYNLIETESGYDGYIKSKPEFTLELKLSSQKVKNSNIDGYKAHLRATYPTKLNAQGYDIIDTDLVCGRKISDRWN